MAAHYYLGAMTQKGFVSALGEHISGRRYFTYILKGGAGTGKSTLMKRVADLTERTQNVTRYHCSSDPDSLDAVVLHDSKVIIADGTAPHIFDPVYPGVCQKIVDLGALRNDEMLKEHSGEIIAVCEKNGELMKSAGRYRSALGEVCRDTFECACSCIDEEKLSGFAQRFCRRLFGKRKGSRGARGICQLSAMTRYGYMTFTETLEDYLDIYLLSDSGFYASHRLVTLVAEYAHKQGYDVKLSPCLVLGEDIYEHLLIDELGIALMTADPLTQLTFRGASRINMGRFYRRERLGVNKERIRTNAAMIKSLSGICTRTMDQAKAVHDEIEKYYIGAMDHKGLDKVCEKICREIAVGD